MSHWNHRVIKKVVDGEEIYSIHEVYYDQDGKLRTYTEQPIGVVSETLKGAKWVLNRMLAALKKPILLESDFPNSSNLS